MCWGSRKYRRAGTWSRRKEKGVRRDTPKEKGLGEKDEAKIMLGIG